ncbi:MAG: M23 family metallopeptidase [Firmicutes bacterium]|nr:M23 family metallopeptidase [Bacillota bacterium]
MARKLRFPREWLNKRLPLKNYREKWRKRVEAARLTLRSAWKGLTGRYLFNRQVLTYLLVFLLSLISGVGGYYLARQTAPRGALVEEDKIALLGEGEASPEALVFSAEDEGRRVENGATSGKGVVGEEEITKDQVREEKSAAALSTERGEDALQEPAPGEAEFLPPEPAALGGNPMAPVVAPITSAFGWRLHPVYGDWRYHCGVDLAAPVATPIQAVLDGVVKDIYKDQHLGQVLVLDHGRGFATHYGHCGEVSVAVGQHINQGDVIATVGETGYGGSHLHFELRCQGQALNPEEYLPLKSPPN